jgi:hypothetical protein
MPEPLQIDINFELILRLADHVREGEDSVYLGTTVTKNPAWVRDTKKQPYQFTRCAWLNDINGIEIGFETIDFLVDKAVYRYGNTPQREFVSHTRPNTIDERVYDLCGAKWQFRWRFGLHYRDTPIFVFQGREGGVVLPVLIGCHDSYIADMTMLRIFLDLNQLGGRTAERFPPTNPYPRNWGGTVQARHFLSIEDARGQS